MRREKYGDLQEKGSKVLKKIAKHIVGPEYLFIRLMCESLNLPDYTVKRFLNKTVTKEYILYNFGKLERSIKYTIDRCCDGGYASDLDPEFVQANRACYEETYLDELRKIHAEAMERYRKT